MCEQSKKLQLIFSICGIHYEILGVNKIALIAIKGCIKIGNVLYLNKNEILRTNLMWHIMIYLFYIYIYMNKLPMDLAWSVTSTSLTEVGKVGIESKYLSQTFLSFLSSCDIRANPDELCCQTNVTWASGQKTITCQMARLECIIQQDILCKLITIRI